MAFEEYQFLRYFIPGSLYVIYLTFLIVPNLNAQVIGYLFSHPDILIGIVGGAFGASLAFGYLIYSFYDWVLYNRLAMHCRKGKRRILGYMNSKIEKWNTLCDSQKKEFLDMLYRLPGDSEKNQQIADLARGMWSHFNARVVCAVFVPILASLSVVSFCFIDWFVSQFMTQWASENHLLSAWVLNFQLLFIVAWVLTVCGISIALGKGATRPYEEASNVEYFYIRHKIECGSNESLTTEFEELVTKFLRRKVKNEEEKETKEEN